MNKKMMITGTVLALAISGSALAFGGKSHNPVDFLERVVDLTDSQVAQIEQIHEQQKAQFKSQFPAAEGEKRNKRSKHGKQKMLKALMFLDPDSSDYQGKLEQMANEAAAKVKAKILLRGETRQKIHAVLTEQQKQELRAKREKMQKKMQERQQRHAEKG